MYDFTRAYRFDFEFIACTQDEYERPQQVFGRLRNIHFHLGDGWADAGSAGFSQTTSACSAVQVTGISTVIGRRWLGRVLMSKHRGACVPGDRRGRGLPWARQPAHINSRADAASA